MLDAGALIEKHQAAECEALMAQASAIAPAPWMEAGTREQITKLADVMRKKS